MTALRPHSPVLLAGLVTMLGAPSSPAATLGSAPIVCPFGAVAIPAGAGPIGTRALDGFDDDEQPRHVVQLTRAYCIDRTEVTVADYARCVKAGRCAPARPAFASPDYPMTDVSWRDARDACAFRGGRLPSEAEWERAARGVDERLYPWGDWRPRCDYADAMYETTGHCRGYGPSPVGSFPAGASPYGVLDLAGNVLEWVDDAFAPEAYRTLGPIDPRAVDERAPRHGVRGGSWEYDVVHSLRVSERDGYPTDLRDPTLGFRCAYDVTKP